MKIPVVYSMGKVGSSAISSPLREAGLRCYDVHTLNKEALIRHARSYLDRGELVHRWIGDAMGWRDLLIRPSHCYYITAVREPVARNISAFFQNRVGLDSAADDAIVAATVERFLSTYRQTNSTKWFDREFKRFLDIDVFSIPFDHERRVMFGNKIQFVLFRDDCDDAVKSKVLSKRFGREIIVARRHESAAKGFAGLYEAVRRNARFTPEFLDPLYKSRYVRHFWTPDEIERFRSFWLGER